MHTNSAQTEGIVSSKAESAIRQKLDCKKSIYLDNRIRPMARGTINALNPAAAP